MPLKSAGRRPKGEIINLIDFKAAQNRPIPLKIGARVQNKV
jgi:hypothetical protein